MAISIFLQENDLHSTFYMTSQMGMMTLEIPTPQWPDPLLNLMKPSSPQLVPQEFLISQKSFERENNIIHIFVSLQYGCI